MKLKNLVMVEAVGVELNSRADSKQVTHFQTRLIRTKRHKLGIHTRITHAGYLPSTSPSLWQ